MWGRKDKKQRPEAGAQPLSGAIDLHAHILPGKDDGAENAEEVAGILRAARSSGYLLVAATPHVMAEGVLKERVDILQALEELKSDPALGDLAPMLVPGAEYYMDEAFFSALERGDLLPLGGVGRRHVLVEVSMMGMPNFMPDAAFKMRVKGWTPVLAHPERYMEVTERPERMSELKEMGYLLQGNLSSLAGAHGRHVRRALEAGLKQGLIDYLASDAHSPRGGERAYNEGIDYARGIVGDKELRRLLIEFPSGILAEQ